LSPTDDYTEKGTYALQALSEKHTKERVHPGCLPLGGKPRKKKLLSANYNKTACKKMQKSSGKCNTRLQMNGFLTGYCLLIFCGRK
jgi:hypothetical protein